MHSTTSGNLRAEEIEYIEKVVEIPEVVYEERITHVPKIETREFLVEVPKIVFKEKIVEVPEIEYKEITIERIVEVPEIREEIVIKEVPVPQYVEKPIPEYITVEVPQDVERIIPVPVEVETVYELLMPTLRPQYRSVKVPIYVPRFIEIPIPVEMLDPDCIEEAQQLSAQVRLLCEQDAPSLADIEKLAECAKNSDIQSHLCPENLQAAVMRALPFQSAIAG